MKHVEYRSVIDELNKLEAALADNKVSRMMSAANEINNIHWAKQHGDKLITAILCISDKNGKDHVVVEIDRLRKTLYKIESKLAR